MSSGSEDGISIKIIKPISENTRNHLVKLINTLYELGSFPTKLKMEKVIPIHKRGFEMNPSNFRPIYILSCFSKIIETLFKTQMIKFIDNYSILSTIQFGFVDNRSANDTMYNFLQ